MFTGIVEQVGEIAAIETTATGRRVVIRTHDLGNMAVGASISVNGVCLTAVEASDASVVLDVVPETLDRTNLGDLTTGSKVNLEMSMRTDGRFDGHIVQGHVDGTGTVRSISRRPDGSVEAEVAVEAPMLRYIVEKGSVAVDGVSLTVSSVDEGAFRVALIPHTLAITTLGLRTEGDTVNLEVDVLAKYVERLLEHR